MLTDTAIKRAKIKPKPYKLHDFQGLFLHVLPSGRKVWRLRYYWDNKEKVLTIGDYPGVAIAEARRERDKAQKAKAEGIRPNFMVEIEKDRKAVQMACSFEMVAREWFQLNLPRWTEIHAKKTIQSLERWVFPLIGPYPIQLLEPPTLMKLLQDIQKSSAIETAHRVRQRMSAVFVYGIATGRVKSDPAALLSQVLIPAKKQRMPAVLTVDEARSVIRGAEQIAATARLKLAHRFLALTAVRPGVLQTFPWHEARKALDNDGIWIIPAARMKLPKELKDRDERDHIVPLSNQAIEILEILEEQSGNAKYVFPNDRSIRKPMSENALSYLLKRAGFQGVHVPHGWRASFSTIMNERRRQDAAIIDLMLAHIPKNQVEAAYNRAMHLDARKAIAQEWADLLTQDLPGPRTLLKYGRHDVPATINPI